MTIKHELIATYIRAAYDRADNAFDRRSLKRETVEQLEARIARAFEARAKRAKARARLPGELG